MGDALSMPKGVAATPCDTPCACEGECAAVLLGVYGLFRADNNPTPVTTVPVVSGTIGHISTAWIEGAHGEVSFVVRGRCEGQRNSREFRIGCRRLNPPVG